MLFIISVCNLYNFLMNYCRSLLLVFIYKFSHQMENNNSSQQPQSKSVCLTVLGCFGGLFTQLVIGSLYQWGIINIYVTSYFKLSDPLTTLQGNAIAFPVMMMCIGVTMRLGLFLSEKTHPLIVLSINAVISAACIFGASYVDSMGAFVALYGIIFGLISGLNFMIPIVECNRYYPGKKMYINGIILIGTGAGSVVFGNFSYNFLNPDKIRPNQGYYIGNDELQSIALKVPECLRWLSLLYLAIGVLGLLMLAPVAIKNRQKTIVNDQQINQKEQEADNNSEQRIEQRNQEKIITESSPKKIPKKLPPIDLMQSNSQQKIKFENQKGPEQGEQNNEIVEVHGEAKDLKQAFCSFICWYQLIVLITGSVGVFLVNGNYKTYVKEEIDDDDFLTIIGIVGSVGNGVSRFFWNLLFSRTGYKTVILLNLSIQITIYAIIRFTVLIPGVYLFLVFLINCCLGGLLVMGPTVAQEIFGQQTGSNIYGFYWCGFAVANFIQFAFVAGLSLTTGFNAVIYICLGITVVSVLMVIFGKFEGPWKNKLDHLRYCSSCC